VFAHPSNSPGARAAIEGGVDVLAHTFPTSLDGSPWDRALPAMMKERGMALIPTLKLWPYELRRAGLSAELVELVLGNGVAQTRAFAELGGLLLFGTDVGYMTDYDPTEEFVYLQRAGLAPAQILAMLTTAPADRFGRVRTGRLAPGLRPTSSCSTATPRWTCARSRRCARRCGTGASSTGGRHEHRRPPVSFPVK
jgi:imidazolonepropionase-like amidohydrolase